MKWIVALLVILLYVHLFNAVSPMYFESGNTMTLMDLWKRIQRNLGLALD